RLARGDGVAHLLRHVGVDVVLVELRDGALDGLIALGGGDGEVLRRAELRGGGKGEQQQQHQQLFHSLSPWVGMDWTSRSMTSAASRCSLRRSPNSAGLS